MNKIFMRQLRVRRILRRMLGVYMKNDDSYLAQDRTQGVFEFAFFERTWVKYIECDKYELQKK